MESVYRHAGTMDLLTSCNDTNWIDSVSHSDTCIIQQFDVAGHCTLFTYCSLFGQQSICLALSVCYCLWSFIAAAELNCGISKGISVGRWHAPAFSRPLSNMKSIYWCLAWAGCRLKTFYCLFSDHSANSDSRHKGVACFKGWQRSLCTWSIQAQSSLSSAQTKTALCLSHAHIIIKPTEQRLDRQPVCWDRQHITLSSTCTHLQHTYTHTKLHKQMASFGMEILYSCGFFKYSATDRHFAQTIPLLNKLATVAGAANTGTISGVQSRLTFPECAAVVEKVRWAC